MKTHYKAKFLLLAGTLIALTPTTPSPALVSVHDAGIAVQSATHEVINLGKYVTMIAREEAQIANQIEQINHQVEQLRRFGDPNYYMNMLGLTVLFAELRDIQMRANLTVYEFNRIVQAGEALRYTGQGLYQDMTTLPDRFGNTVKYDVDSFKKFAVVQRTYDNYAQQQKLYTSSVEKLNAELNDTLNKLNAAGTQMEVEKYQAKIAAINTAHQQAHHQMQVAGQLLQVQDIANRNDAARVAEAQRQREIQETATESESFARSMQELLRAPSRR